MVKIVQPVSDNARVVVKDVVASQNGVGTTDGEKLAESLAKVLQVTEQTDITAAKWLKETNSDPELSILRPAIIDGKEKEVPLNYKLLKDEISIDMGLVFVSGKLAVPKSLKEWVIQAAHGDHLAPQKMEKLTELVYWPGKSKDLKEKARSCLTCVQAGKNLHTMLPTTEKIN